MSMPIKLRRNKRSKFIPKLHQILLEPESGAYWREDGQSFVLSNFSLIVESSLPKFFRHSNLSSLIRQLNIYGFKKLYGSDIPQNTYHHSRFKKDNFQQLKPIRSYYNKEKYRSKVKKQEDRPDYQPRLSKKNDMSEPSAEKIEALENQLDICKAQLEQLRKQNDRLRLIQTKYIVVTQKSMRSGSSQPLLELKSEVPLEYGLQSYGMGATLPNSSTYQNGVQKFENCIFPNFSNPFNYYRM